MAAQSADANERAAIRRFAADPGRVRVTKTTQYDLLAHDLTTEDICREITSWIDGGRRIKKVILRGQHVKVMLQRLAEAWPQLFAQAP
jgi:hypothetical protein